MGTPPGWYDDGQQHLRYWDGAAWTHHTRPLSAATTRLDAVSPRRERSRRIAAIAAATAAAVAIAVAGALLVPPLLRDDAQAAPSASASLGAPWDAGDLESSAQPAVVNASEADLVRTVEAFVRAWAEGDCTTEWELSTREWTFADSAQEYCAQSGGGMVAGEFIDVAIDSAEIDGAAATVVTVETYDWHGDGALTQERWSYSAVLTESGWKVAQTSFVE